MEYLAKNKEKWQSRRIAECKQIKEEEKADRLAIVREKKKRYGLKGLSKEESKRLRSSTEDKIMMATARANLWKRFRDPGSKDIDMEQEEMKAWDGIKKSLDDLGEGGQHDGQDQQAAGSSADGQGPQVTGSSVRLREERSTEREGRMSQLIREKEAEGTVSVKQSVKEDLRQESTKEGEGERKSGKPELLKENGLGIKHRDAFKFKFLNKAKNNSTGQVRNLI